MNKQATAEWIVPLKTLKQPGLRLFCFPYAGGAASAFRGWLPLSPDSIELFALQLPGRGNRLAEEPFDRLEPLVDAVLPQVLPLLDSGRSFAFFGHSMGAAIAFEIARRLRFVRGLRPAHLFVSGRSAPQVPRTSEIFFDAPESEFVERILRMGGTPPEVRDHPELLEIVLPILRADFAISQTYAYATGPPLDCPITAFGGIEDTEVPIEEVAQWREQTSAVFAMHRMPGGHFFLKTAQTEICKIIFNAIQGVPGQKTIITSNDCDHRAEYRTTC